MNIHFIGDPHLGRSFDVGTPRHRRGEREMRQMAHYIQELHVECDLNVMVGDLFDSPYVAQQVIVAAARAKLSAAESNPNVMFVDMAGNHDVPRNLTAVGAWTTYSQMVNDRLPNLVALRHPRIIDGVLFCPWDWATNASDQVRQMARFGHQVSHVVGHWDLQQFGEDDSHLAPTRIIRELFGDVPIHSGHYHKPGIYNVDGIDVTCTGSLEPYSHGEDPDGRLYVTMTLRDLLSAPQDELRNKHVRVIVKEGEEIPEIDCLGLTHMRTREEKEAITLSPATFDWHKMLRRRIGGLAPRVQTFIKERIPVDAEHPSSDEADGPRPVPRPSGQAGSQQDQSV